MNKKMKRMLPLFLLGAFLTTNTNDIKPVLAQEASLINAKFKVTSNVYIRKTPNSKYSPIGIAKKGEYYVIEKEINGFYKVKDQEKYIAARFLEKMQARTYMGMFHAKSNVYIRKTPDSKYKPIGIAKEGMVYPIEKKVNGYYKVLREDKYIAATFMASGRSRNIPAQFKQATGGVNIRPVSGTNKAPIGKLRKNDIIEVDRIQDGFFKIKGKEQYVSALYLKDYNPPIKPEEQLIKEMPNYSILLGQKYYKLNNDWRQTMWEESTGRVGHEADKTSWGVWGVQDKTINDNISMWLLKHDYNGGTEMLDKKYIYYKDKNGQVGKYMLESKELMTMGTISGKYSAILRGTGGNKILLQTCTPTKSDSNALTKMIFTKVN